MAEPNPWPPSLKAIRPYIFLAKQVQVAKPLVSYYANLYALQRGIRERDTSDKAAADYISSLLTKCEGLRPQFAPDIESHRDQLVEFALNSYEGAERQYMSGSATRLTAQEFYATIHFFDICTHFGDLPDDLETMRKKSRVFAGKISKDIREGKQPLPPAQARVVREEDEEEQLRAELSKSGISQPDIPPAPEREYFAASDSAMHAVSSSAGSSDRGSSYNVPPSAPKYPSIGSIAEPEGRQPAAPPTGPSAKNSFLEQPSAAVPPPAPHAPEPATAPQTASFAAPAPVPAPAPAPAPASIPTTQAPHGWGAAYEPDAKEMREAHKHAKYAMSALDFQDTATAIKELRTALSLLEGPAPP